MYGSQMGDLIVYTRVGTVDTPVWKLSGDKGNSWKQAQVQISSKQPYKVWPSWMSSILEGLQDKYK